MIIAVAGQKGGTGKSTIAVHLAAEWLHRGQRVLLVDADPQASAMAWAEAAAAADREIPEVVALGDNLRKTLPRLAVGFDVAIIDCPGRKASKRQAGALMVADVALLPCGPSTFDTWALTETLELVDQIQEVRPDLLAAIVVNRRSHTVEGRTARNVLAESGLAVLTTELGQRVAYSEALAAGLGVTRYAEGQPASAEMKRLADEIEGLFTGSEFTDGT